MSIRAFPDLLKVSGVPVWSAYESRRGAEARLYPNSNGKGEGIPWSSRDGITEDNVNTLPDRLQDQLSPNVH